MGAVKAEKDTPVLKGKNVAVIGGGNGYLYVGLGCVLAGLFAHIIVNKRIR